MAKKVFVIGIDQMILPLTKILADQGCIPNIKKLIDNIQIESGKGFTLSLELTAKAHRLGYKITEIPTTWKERNKGRSRFRLFSFIPPYLKWFFYIIQTSTFKKNEK